LGEPFKVPQVQAASFNDLTVTASSPTTYIERYRRGGWAGTILQLMARKYRSIGAVSLEFPCFQRLLVTPALLGNHLEQG
jgi:hypothetical protein